jgi:hypothetical protein
VYIEKLGFASTKMVSYSSSICSMKSRSQSMTAIHASVPGMRVLARVEMAFDRPAYVRFCGSRGG